jgi:hypothetical protein
MTVAIVTCFLYVSDKEENYQEYLDKIVREFTFLVSIPGFVFFVYTNNAYYSRMCDAFCEFPGVTVINVDGDEDEDEDTHIPLSISELANSATSLPANRNTEKDTRDFIASGYYKYDLLKDAVERRGDDISHFMWTDMDLPKLFRDKDGVKEYLQWLSRLQLASSFLTFPGCWSKLEKEREQEQEKEREKEKERVVDSVHWRFCGGFFIGDAASITQFCETVGEGVRRFTEKFDTLVWDFNLWAWLESDCSRISDDAEKVWPEHWTWYRGDHNDSILYTSADIYTRTLELDSVVEYPYPAIDTYYPTSAAYLCHQGKHWLNTRYVNYWIYPSGCYHFNNGQRLIENKNMLSELDGETLMPISYREIDETIDLPVKEGDILSKGLEDIRLYAYAGGVKYVAATVGYSPSGKCRMIMGDYDVDDATIRSAYIVQPPTDTWAEKNWIPIIRKNKLLLGDGTMVDQDEELFIYKWSPLEIGRVQPRAVLGEDGLTDGKEEMALNIVHSYPMSMPLFSKIRGSTIFQEVEDGLLGIVHYSEEHAPRHYYHMLVLLEKDSFMLKRYSETFCFQKLGVEFCIGMLTREEDYVFWISRHDRDPAMVTVQKDEIRWMDE